VKFCPITVHCRPQLDQGLTRELVNAGGGMSVKCRQWTNSLLAVVGCSATRLGDHVFAVCCWPAGLIVTLASDNTVPSVTVGPPQWSPLLPAPIYTVGQKTAPLYFCNNFAKTFCSELIIGTYTL